MYSQQSLSTQKKLLLSGQFKLFICVLSVMFSAYLYAGAATFSTTNIQYLNGSGYELGDDHRGIMTLEHADAWKYGDNFFFVDITNPDRDNTGIYSEVSPRFSFYKMAGSGTKSDGLVKDVLLTLSGEFSGGGSRVALYGVAVDFNIPKFAFFKTNFYVRDEVTRDDEGSQITIAWLLPFKMGETSWAFEGFFDYAFGLDTKEDNIVSAPRLLMDLGSTWGAPGVLQVGVEYQLWRNKFGIDGVDEDVPQMMLKWIL